jgi:hypothetical protein
VILSVFGLSISRLLYPALNGGYVRRILNLFVRRSSEAERLDCTIVPIEMLMVVAYFRLGISGGMVVAQGDKDT